jgi:hypothetical protein
MNAISANLDRGIAGKKQPPKKTTNQTVIDDNE